MTHAYGEHTAQNEQVSTNMGDWLDTLGLTKVKDKAIADIKQKGIEGMFSWAAEHPMRVRTASAFAVIMVIGATAGMLALGYTKGKG